MRQPQNALDALVKNKLGHAQDGAIVRFSERVGANRDSVYKILRGGQALSADACRRWAKVLDADAGELMALSLEACGDERIELAKSSARGIERMCWWLGLSSWTWRGELLSRTLECLRSREGGQ